MKETLIGLPVVAVIAGLLYAAFKYENFSKGIVAALLMVIVLLIAYWIGSLVMYILGNNSKNDDDPGM